MCCSVNRSVCPVCLTVFWVWLLLTVIEVLSVSEASLLDRPAMVFQRMSVLCLCASEYVQHANGVVIYLHTNMYVSLRSQSLKSRCIVCNRLRTPRYAYRP